MEYQLPNYTVRDKSSKEESIVTFPWKEFEEFLKTNPHLEQIICASAIVDPYSVGRKKTDYAFNERLKQIKKNHIGSKITTGNLGEY
jgi:hypothetical protein